MVLEMQGRFIRRSRKGKRGDQHTYWFYVPVPVGRDSSFPFKHRERCTIRIDVKNRAVTISRPRKQLYGSGGAVSDSDRHEVEKWLNEGQEKSKK